jgi:hypothetical protein
MLESEERLKIIKQKQLNLYRTQFPKAINKDINVRFEVLTAASMKMAVFWVVVPCSHSFFMAAANASETSVNFYQTSWRNNTEDSHLQTL